MIVAKKGKISDALILATPSVPCPTRYRARFASLVKAYRLLDSKASWNEQRLEQKRRVQSIRINLLNQITALSQGRVTIDMSATRHTRLRLRTGRLVSVIVGLLFHNDESFCTLREKAWVQLEETVIVSRCLR